MARGRGRPKGAISTDRKRFAETARRLLAEHGEEALARILRGKNQVAVMRALEFLAAYGIGKPVDHIRVGIDPDSPEGILLKLAQQSIPGADFDEQ